MSIELNTEMVTDFLEQKLRNKPVDKLLGKATIVTYGILEDQVAVAASAVKTSQWGGKHGHLALIVNEEKYPLITATTTSIVDRRVNPPALTQKLTARQVTSNASNYRGHKMKNQRVSYPGRDI